MKPLILTVLACLTAATSLAADIRLSDGRVFKQATVVSQEPRKVMIRHAGGMASVLKVLLPEELATKYPVDEVGAAQQDFQAQQDKLNAREARRAESERVNAELMRRESSRQANKAAAEESAASEAALRDQVRKGVLGVASRYFETKYNWVPTKIVTAQVTVYEVRPLEGWAGRWLAKGRAIIKRQDSDTGVSKKQGQQNRSLTKEPEYSLESVEFECRYSPDGSSEATVEVTNRS